MAPAVDRDEATGEVGARDVLEARLRTVERRGKERRHHIGDVVVAIREGGVCPIDDAGAAAAPVDEPLRASSPRVVNVLDFVSYPTRRGRNRDPVSPGVPNARRRGIELRRHPARQCCLFSVKSGSNESHQPFACATLGEERNEIVHPRVLRKFFG